MSSIFALADLHLSFGVPGKSMEVFGSSWEKFTEKIEANWTQSVQPEDLVLIAGDISWAMRPEEALIDLEWIDKLPGTKVMIRGNHDFWWTSLNKVKKILPPSIHVIQNNAFHFKSVAIGGSRLWDTDEYHFSSQPPDPSPEKEKIFSRELARLEMSLQALDPNAPLKIAMTHYPPIGLNLAPSKASALFKKYGVQTVVFGHLHHMTHGEPFFGKSENIDYHLTSCDYLAFKPLLLHKLPI